MCCALLAGRPSVNPVAIQRAVSCGAQRFQRGEACVTQRTVFKRLLTSPKSTCIWGTFGGTDYEKWLSLHNIHAQQMSDSIDVMAGDVKSLGKIIQRLRSEQGLLVGPEESAAKPTKTLVVLAAVEKEIAGKVKKLSQRYANYDFYLQGNGHLDWMFSANAGTESMEIFVQANRLQSGLKQSQVSRIMKSARDFRSRAASFKATAVAITGDALVAESAYREFMQRNPRSRS